jgi:DNA-binding CsgD family transcriptional regulator
MTRAEKEEYVIQLWKAGRTVRQIAELVHMSFRDMGAITNKAKLQAERERGYAPEDTQPKSPESQAFKLFSEGKSPVEIAILLDLAADRVRTIYREYWELSGRYELAQIYEEARYNLANLLKLHKIVKDLGLNEKEIIKVLELVKHNELERLQWKVEHLRNER